MSTLITNYMDAHFRGKRKYTMIENQDSTYSFEDETDYIVALKADLVAVSDQTYYLVTDTNSKLVGTDIPISANVINATTTEINRIIATYPEWIS